MNKIHIYKSIKQLQNLPLEKESTFVIIDNIKSNNPIDELIAEIDQLVYQLYELTEEEIEIIENN